MCKHNGPKISKIGILLHTPVLLYITVKLKGLLFMLLLQEYNFGVGNSTQS